MDVKVAIRQDTAFPHRELVEAIQRVGIGALGPRWTELFGRRPAGPATAKLTNRWLNCLLRMLDGAHSYGAYTQAELFGPYCRETDFERRTWSLSVLFLVDLARKELATPGREHAVFTMLAKLWQQESGQPAPLLVSRSSAQRLCTELANRHGSTERDMLVSVTPLPVTSRTDEYLFLRAVQSIELLVSLAAARVREVCLAGAVAPVALLGCLSALRRTLELCVQTLGILAAADLEQLTHIRAVIVRTGALRAPAFTELERWCNGELRGLVADIADTDSSALATSVTQAVAEVDEVWARWNRLHLGVVRAVTGEVPADRPPLLGAPSLSC